MPHISIAAETVFEFIGFPVTNSLIATVITSLLLMLVAVMVGGSLKRKPGTAQLIAELLVGGLHSFFTDLGGKHGERFFPLVTTIFIFVVASNWFGLLPGVGSIGVYKDEVVHEETEEASVMTEIDPEGEGIPADDHGEEAVEEHRAMVPILRGPTADLNNTIALGVVAFLAIQYFGISTLGLGHFKRYIDISNPIKFFVGLLEAVLDVSKIVSFAFRLFGNIFAGEVLLAVMAFLMPVLVPVPFFMLEVFVGLIQGLVFAMLTGVFISLAVVSHGGEHAHVEAQ